MNRQILKRTSRVLAVVLIATSIGELAPFSNSVLIKAEDLAVTEGQLYSTDTEVYIPELWFIRGTTELNMPFYNAVKEVFKDKDIYELELEDFKNIKELDLSNKGIREIPKVIELFSDLEAIDISFNEIVYVHNDVLEFLIGLERVNFQENYLISIDDSILSKFGKDNFLGNILPGSGQYKLSVHKNPDITFEQLEENVTNTDFLNTILNEDALVMEENGEIKSKKLLDSFSLRWNKEDAEGNQESTDEMLPLKYGTIDIMPIEIVEIKEILLEKKTSINTCVIPKDETITTTAAMLSVTMSTTEEISKSTYDDENFIVSEDDIEEQEFQCYEEISRSERITNVQVLTEVESISASNNQNAQTDLIAVLASDVIAPTIWEITASNKNWTNKAVDITVSAQDFGDGTDGVVWYSFNDETYTLSNTYSVKSNQTVSVKVKDRAGNVSEASITIDNIDTANPTKPDIELKKLNSGEVYACNGTWSSESLKATAKNRTSAQGGSGQSPIKYLLMKDSDGNTYIEDQVDIKIIEQFVGDVYFAYEDEAGNIGEWTSAYNIKIDSKKPKILTVSRANQGQNGGFMPKSNTVTITGIEETLSGIKEYSFDDGLTWSSLKSHTTDRTITWKIRVKSNSGVISDVYSISSGSVDGVKPIVTGIVKKPSEWTNKNVIVTPVGDPTVSSFKGYWLNGVKKDDWGNGYMEYTENMDNQNFAAFDFGYNYADNIIPFSITNIDKEKPYISKVTTTSLGNGTVEVTIYGADDLSGIHNTQGYRINNAKWGTTNTITVANNAEVIVDVQDKATNTNSFTIEIKDGQNKGIAPVLSTDREFNTWGNKNHTISLVGGFHTSGINSLMYKIVTKRNGDGEQVNTESEWKVYTDPFVISQEGEFEVVPALKANDGTLVEGKAYGVWLDKTPPVAPQFNRLFVNGPNAGQEYILHNTKYGVKFIPTNWYVADKLSGVQYMGPRIENGSMSSVTTTPTWQTFSNCSGANNMKFWDFAGNMSATTVSHLNDTMPPTVSYEVSANNLTSDDVIITVSAFDPYYWGMHKLPYKIAGDKDDYENGWAAETSSGKYKLVVSKNGTYTIHVRDSVNNVTSINVKITNIDKEAPVINSVTLSPSEYTNGNVTVTVQSTDDSEELLYSFDGGVSWQKENTKTYNSNTTVQVQVKDQMNRVTKHNNVQISNIDKDTPTITNISKTELSSGKIRLTFEISDIGVSGLPTTPISYNDGEWTNTRITDVDYGELVKVTVRDKAGNTFSTGIIAKVDGSIGSPPIVESADVKHNEWTTLSPTIKIEGGRIIAGIARHEYAISKDGGEYSEYQTYDPNQGIVINSDGIFTIKARAVGKDGTYSQESTGFVVKRDATAPALNYVISPNKNTYSKSYSVTFNATDGLAGLAENFISIGNTISWGKTTLLNIDKNQVVFVYVKDVLGNVSEKHEIIFDKLDHTAPTFELSVSGGISTWTNSPVQVSAINVVDHDDAGNVTLSNMSSTAYDWGLGWNTENKMTITKPSIITLKVRDSLDNISTKSINVPYIDIEKPSTPQITGDVANDTWTNQSVTLSLVGGNNTISGLDKYYIYKNGYLFKEITNSSTRIDDEGEHIITSKAINKAASLSDVSLGYKVKIDKTLPGKPIIELNGKDFETQTITINSTGDNLSGVKRLEYSIDGGAWQTYSKTVTLDSANAVKKNLVVKARAVDNANNISEEETVITNIVMIDVIIPLSLNVELKSSQEDVVPVISIRNNGTPIRISTSEISINDQKLRVVAQNTFSDWGNLDINETSQYLGIGLTKYSGDTVFTSNWFTETSGFDIGILRQDQAVGLKPVFKHGNAFTFVKQINIGITFKVESIY